VSRGQVAVPDLAGSEIHLSVVIPTMNKVELLERTLAALQQQRPGEGISWEIVVVNDGSTDDTAGFLAREAAAHHGGETPLKVVTPPANVGRARARNLGAGAARGRWILFLDDDIVVPPGLLQAHLDVLRLGREVGTIGRVETEPALIDGPLFHYLDSRGVARLPEGPAPGRYFVTQNAAVPRRAFLEVGGFDEGFSGYGFEDMEVAFRLEEEAGIRFHTVTRPVPLHVHHHTLEEYFAKKVECGRQSLPHLARLHPHRIPEMHLHHVVEVPNRPRQGRALGFAIALLARTGLGRLLRRLLGYWPSVSGFRPLLPGLYFPLMNLAVMICFRQGIIENTD
jgi:glycosyltransferase involved in cell wall biosynthesis